MTLATYHKLDLFLKYLRNVRPTCEAVKTRRRSSRPIFQPKRQKTAPTSVKQAMLSIPCTICPPSPKRMVPHRNQRICDRAKNDGGANQAENHSGHETQKTLIILSWFLTRGHLENRAGRKHAFQAPFPFYGNDGTKFPKNLPWDAPKCPLLR
jgi:hypothetical protein